MRDNDLNLNSRFEFAYSELKKIKEQRPNFKNVFDIGSGNELLKERILALGLNYFSFDLYPPNDSVRKWNIEEQFPYGESADVVIFLEVIEHLDNPQLCLRNISDVLVEGGSLILSTPNPSWSGSRLHLLGKGVLGMFTEEDLELNHHVFTAWPHIVRFMLEQSTFSNIKIVSLGKKTSMTAYPFWGIKLPVRILYRSLKKIIESKDSQAIGALYGMVAKKSKNNAAK